MRAEFNGEVKRAIFILMRNNSILLSHLGIEDKILKNPDEFPNFSRLPNPQCGA